MLALIAGTWIAAGLRRRDSTVVVSRLERNSAAGSRVETPPQL